MTLAFSLFAALRVADSVMTWYAVNHGYKELNPLVAWAVKNAWLNALVCIGSLVAVWFIVTTLPPFVGWLLLGSGIIVQGYVVVSNIRTLTK